jgi:hypothetical protein
MSKKPDSLEETLEPLSTQELAALERLPNALLRLRQDFEKLLTRLRKKKDSPTHDLVVSRLECLVVDRLTPALADLSSIAETARGHFEIEGEGPDLDPGSRHLDPGSRSSK